MPTTTPPRVTICPECAAGKCRNCDGSAWDDVEDDYTPCTCTHGKETPVTDNSDERLARYGMACGDPGATTPRLNNEPLSRWSARAAIAVADAELAAVTAERDAQRDACALVVGGLDGAVKEMAEIGKVLGMPQELIDDGDMPEHLYDTALGVVADRNLARADLAALREGVRALLDKTEWDGWEGKHRLLERFAALLPSDEPDPTEPELTAELVVAVQQAYTAEGVAIWWRSHGRADTQRRRRMEVGVLAEYTPPNPTDAAPEPEPAAEVCICSPDLCLDPSSTGEQPGCRACGLLDPEIDCLAAPAAGTDTEEGR